MVTTFEREINVSWKEGNNSKEDFLEKFIILKQVGQTVLAQISLHLALFLSNEFISRIYINFRQIPFRFPEEHTQTS